MSGQNSAAAGAPQRILPCGETALLLEYVDLPAALAHYEALAAAQLPGVLELVPAARTVLVLFDPGSTTLQALLAAIRGTAAAAGGTQREGSEVVLDVVYDGADLREAAVAAGCSVAELVRWHEQSEWRAAFAGFAPGFVYCINTTQPWQFPRRDTPRPRIPAGAVAVAGEFGAVYPRQSPGGWQLLGTTTAELWDTGREQPALLQPGDRVRYRAVRAAIVAGAAAAQTRRASGQRAEQAERAEMQRAAAEQAEVQAVAATQASATETAAQGVFEVVRPGLQLLLQDAGRPGYRGLGVGAAGAADLPRLRAANQAVGNDPHALALEVTVGGALLRVKVRTLVSWAGDDTAAMLLRHDTPATPERLAPGRAYTVEPGDELEIAVFTAGLRGYLAVRGGFRAARLLGSAATDTLAGLGPAPLQAGDFVAVADPPAAGIVAPVKSALPELPRAGETVVLQAVLGPRDDWFTAAAIADFAAQCWEVTAAADRVGVRLRGKTALERRLAQELPSEGVVAGAIQVPADGQPVVFLADHPVTGGYPVVAVLTPAALALAAQLAPGMRVLFELVPAAAVGASESGTGVPGRIAQEQLPNTAATELGAEVTQ